MIGNDVVDLQLARTESNWKRKGFLQKLFTESEQAMILQHHDPEIMLWVLWSMKEAAYKIYNRETGVRAFIPHKLECEVTSDYNNKYIGKVHCSQFIYYTISTIKADIIHTIAKERPVDLKAIEVLNLDKIIKNALGLPSLFEDRIEIPVSVSHHGRAVIAVR